MYYQVLQVPIPGFLQYTSLYALKSVSFILIFNSLLLLNNPPFSSTISYAIFFLFGFPISILSYTNLPKFLSSVILFHLIHSRLSYLYLPIYCSKILLSLFVLWCIAKVKEYHSLPPSVVDILPLHSLLNPPISISPGTTMLLYFPPS